MIQYSISTFIGWINKVCIVPGGEISTHVNNDGSKLDRNSEDEIQPGRYVIRSPPPGELARYPVVPTGDLAS